jgi:pSer/pThr/pTyr-binding forkhead associated (FHA) protein
VSSHHCRIELEKGCIRVVDLGSTNGTFINEELVSDAFLQVGDSFMVGIVSLDLQLKLKRAIEPLPEIPGIEDPGAMIESQRTQKIDPRTSKRKTDKLAGPIKWQDFKQEEEKPMLTQLFSFSKKK